ncbi:MAG: ElyC/SanA/YdcF family protein [Candidatus Moraniibacteriota bacterium]
MHNIFLIPGYGIPKNILEDENYNFYLKLAFNKIYNFVAESTPAETLIICCGGKTDMIKPYKRTEADEMNKFFAELIKQKPFLAPITKNWVFISEKESLSTLENLINSKKIIEKQKIKNARIFIFCEQTREKRIKTLAKKIFSSAHNIKIIAIDFDLSSNRYLSPEFLAKKEKANLKHLLWAMQSPENLKKHRELLIEKINYLRKAGPKAHTDAVKKWWEQKLKELD